MIDYPIMISALEVIFCVFLAEDNFVKELTPLKGVLKIVRFIQVRGIFYADIM